MNTTHNDTATSAIAMAVGLDFNANQDAISKFAENNGAGMLEFYSALGAFAELSAKLANAVAACPDFAEADFPGVYAYEVDGEYGEEVTRRIIAGGNTSEQAMRYVLGMLAADFFSQCDDAPHALAIIKEMTGYDTATDSRAWCMTVEQGARLMAWYFGSADQAAAAREAAHAPGSGVRVVRVQRQAAPDMPKYEPISSAEEFRAWLAAEPQS